MSKRSLRLPYIAALLVAFSLGIFTGRTRSQSSQSSSAVCPPCRPFTGQGISLGSGHGPTPADFADLLRASQLHATRPPVRPGATGNAGYSLIPFQVLSQYPRVVLLPNFIDAARAAAIIAMAEPHIRPSGLALKKGETKEGTTGIRTSQGTFLPRSSDPSGVLAWVEARIAEFTGIPAGHGEPFNVLRYEPGQKYNSHYDSFSEKDYGVQKEQRLATVLLYLSDVAEGGETIFPLEGKDGLSRLKGFNYTHCDVPGALKYAPRTGDAILFHATGPTGKIDPHALHGGCPVINGTKWVATKWIRDHCNRNHVGGPRLGDSECRDDW